MGILWTVVRLGWPFLLAGAVWAWQEVHIVRLNVALASSLKRENVAQSELSAARQRATDLALLYAGMIPKVDAAARAQEEKDRVRMDSLNDRIRSLSRAPAIRFSPDAARVLDDVSAAANGRDAGPAVEPEGGAAAVPAVPEVVVSEQAVVEFSAVAAEAYLSCVRMFHETRDLYNAARSAQLKANQK